MENKYVTTQISGIIMTISKRSEKKGYSESVIYCNLPDEGISEKKERIWIKENNARMNKICQFMNENNL